MKHTKDTQTPSWFNDFRNKYEGANSTTSSKTIDSMVVDIDTYIAKAKAEGAREVIGTIQYRLDFAKHEVEMAEDPADPKVRIHYFESFLATLREDYQLEKEV